MTANKYVTSIMKAAQPTNFNCNISQPGDAFNVILFPSISFPFQLDVGYYLSSDFMISQHDFSSQIRADWADFYWLDSTQASTSHFLFSIFLFFPYFRLMAEKYRKNKY